MENLHFIKASGAEIRPFLTDLGKLRIAVFHDFPYLYEGSLEYEKEYLEVYVNAPESILFGIYHHDQLIGATTGMPLNEETAAIKAPFEKAGIDIRKVYYFGESILLPHYRGLGFGHRFFDEREAHAVQLGYHTTAFCSVIRPENHPLKPSNYRPNDAFWIKRAYLPQPHLLCEMSWLDRGDLQETNKSLVFWIKEHPQKYT